MTETEQREIDKRVAVAMGWRWSLIPSYGMWVFNPPHPVPSVRGNQAKECLGDGDVPIPPGHPIRHPDIPAYTTDPAAADLVKRHMEGNGWQYASGTASLRSYIDNGEVGTHRFFGVAWFPDSDGDWGSWSRCFGDADIEETALCLAFLAAVDAESKGKEEEKP